MTLTTYFFRGSNHLFFDWRCLPSRELTYSPKMALLTMIFLFPRWDMLIPWRVNHLFAKPSFSQTAFRSGGVYGWRGPVPLAVGGACGGLATQSCWSHGAGVVFRGMGRLGKMVGTVGEIMTGWWFQIFFMFIPTWGNDPIWLIFFKWVETTN